VSGRGLLLGVLGALAAAAAAAAAPSTADMLARCRGIEAPGARLACYDAAAGRPAEAAASTAPVTMTTPASPPPVAPAPSPEATRAEQLRNFGLSATQIQPQAQGPEAIRARIAGLSADRVGHAVVSLDNGQTWLVADDASRLEIGQDVTIKRAALGSFLMTTGDRRAYSVRRSR
jgi:hypothetical protein